MSATMEPGDGTITLRLDHTGMNGALRALDRRYSYDSRVGDVMTDSRVARWGWKLREGKRETEEYLKKHFGP